ncbi:hypothetical protein OROGR_010182 [Orobanche gracilis]
MAHQQCYSYMEMEADALTVRSHHPPGSGKPQFLINLEFTSKFHFHYRGGKESRHLDSFTVQPLSGASILISLQEFLRHKTARISIGSKLECWPLSGETRLKIADNVLGYARRAMPLMPVHYNVLCLYVRVDVFFRHAFCSTANGSTTGAGRVSTVRADEGNLMKSKGILSAGGVCAVCLDEFSGDIGRAVYLPCAHRFHEDCIEKWLRNCRKCPVCRFEIPTS